MVNEQKEYTVYGKVTGPEGKVLQHVPVIIWWQRIRKSLPVAEGHSDDEGNYRLAFKLPEHAPGRLMIVVEAISEKPDLKIKSVPIEAGEDLEVNLAAEPADNSKFTALLRKIIPLLDRLSLLEIVETTEYQDISYLSQELNISTEQIMQVVLAERLANVFKLPAAAFYAFLYQRIPSSLPSPLLDATQNFTLIVPLVHNIGSIIFSLPKPTQKAALTGAIALDIIGQQYTGRIDDLLEKLQAGRLADLLNGPYLIGSASLSQLLQVPALPQQKQELFSQVLASNTGSMRKFWRKLAAGNSGFTPKEASDIERTLSIGSFVKNYVPLVQALFAGFNNGAYTNLSDLARLNVQDWVKLFDQTGVPPGIDAAGKISAAEVFASVVHNRITRVYPTVALVSRLSNISVIPPGIQKPLVQFFQNNPGLELVKDNIPAFLATQGAAAFNGINKQNRDGIIKYTRTLQRVMRVAPDVNVSQVLLQLGFTSAYSISKLGKQQFFVKATAAGLTKPEANQVYYNAASRHANVVSLYMKLNADSIGLLPAAVGSNAEINKVTQTAVQRDQSLATLFGSQDYCKTDDCASILSAAAYLCDLQLWLRNIQQATGTVLDVVEKRRPDIRHLLLNCPNTNTELPYIDLVIELLADAISPPLDTLGTTYDQSALTNGTAIYYIITAVNNAGEGVPSAQVSATPAAPAIAPAAPAGVALTPGNGKVTLSWTDIPGADSYNIYWATATGVTPANGSQVIGATNPYTQLGLSNGTNYYYIVTAVNAAGEGPPSPEMTTAPLFPAAAPAVPAGLVAVPSEGSVTLNWDSVAGADSYNIYWSTVPGVTPVSGTKITGPSSPFIQGALVDGNTYYYIVTAVNSIGEGAPSAQVSATPQVPAAAPAAPAGVAAVAGNGKVMLSWSPVPGATSYNIYWSTVSGVTVKNGNEITGSMNPKWKQTSPGLTAAQLSAAPEYFNQGAFNILFNASYPQNLPYSAGLDALRAYLQQLKLPLWQLKAALMPLAGGSQVQQAALGAERFGMSPHNSDLITNADFVSRNIAWNTGALDPINTLVQVSPPDTNPSQLSFLTAASIAYEQLLELLQVGWVQKGLGVQIQGINDLCMTSVQQLSPSPLDPGFLDRAHRFIRLWLSTGYKMWELDLLLLNKVIANKVLDKNALANLFYFRQLQDKTGFNVSQQLVFFQDIDTAAHRDPDGSMTVPFYAQVFLNPAVTSVAPDPDLAALAYGGTPADPALGNHLPAIQAALAVSAADASLLLNLTDNQLTLSNLSLIYRVTSLAYASGLSISSLLQVALLLNPAPANYIAAVTALFTSPTVVTSFLAQAKTLQSSGLSFDALSYLLTPPASTALAQPISALGQTSITVTNSSWFPASNFYIQIGAEILLVSATGGPQNNIWTVSRGEQGTAPALALIGTSVTLIGQWATSSQIGPADISSALASVQQSVLNLMSTNATLTTAINNVALKLSVSNSLGFPAPPFYVAIGPEILLVNAMSGNGNTDWVVVRGQQGTAGAPAAIGAAVTPTGGDLTGAVIAAVAANAHSTASAGLANDVTALLLTSLNLPGSASTLLKVLSDPAFITSGNAINAANFPDQFLALQLFDKCAVLVRGLRLVSLDLTWLLASATIYQGLDFSQLPVTTAQPALPLSALLNTFLVVQLSRSWTKAATDAAIVDLYGIITGVNAGTLASETQTQAALVTITGWQQSDIQAFASALGLVYPLSYQSPSAYDALRNLQAMIMLTGTNAAQLVYWATSPPDEMTAQAMASSALGVLKSKQPGSGTWLKLAPKFMNPLRDNRAAALIASLTGMRDSGGNLVYGDTNSLFDYFLIDVQMSSCQVTSRVVQDYIALQIFVERSFMNKEYPNVIVDLDQNDTWSQWQWMKRYRIWEANREVFLYPENWLIESQRPNRTEIYQKLEQEVRQGQNNKDTLEAVVLNYIDRLDGISHLRVTGTCESPNDINGQDIYVIARSLADPPVFYIRSCIKGAWGGWVQIPLTIKAHQVVPAMYRGRICLFWPDIKVAAEPHQLLPAAQSSTGPPSQEVERYVSIGLYFSVFRNGSWAPAQSSKGKLFDKPLFTSAEVVDLTSVEALYSLKVQSPVSASGYGANLFLDLFRCGKYDAPAVANLFHVLEADFPGTDVLGDTEELASLFSSSSAVHIGRALFDGRFNDLELSTDRVFAGGNDVPMLLWAQETYGPEARPLLPLAAPDPDLAGEPNLVPQEGVLVTAAGSGVIPLAFNSTGSLDNDGTLLNTAQSPFHVVGPASSLNFDPSSYFFFQDNRRCYFVESQKTYWTGSMFSPAAPSDPGSVPFQLSYTFRSFYFPFARLFWNQLAAGGFDLLYDPDLQQAPDAIDPAYPDVFSFNNNYQPFSWVHWDHSDVATTLASAIDANQSTITVVNNIYAPLPGYYVTIGSETISVLSLSGPNGTTWTVERGMWGTAQAAAPAGAAVTPLMQSQDRQFLDFTPSAPFSVYNWELFYHIPLYIAQLLNQNLQFEDAEKWFQYIFNPTRQSKDPVPQRFWITKPLHDLTAAQIIQQDINVLLQAVNQGNAGAVQQIELWRQDPFNPFLLADNRPVAYMKNAVMAYIDNLVNWADNLFSTQSREALSEATLLYVIAAEILGPQPVAITPPQHADESFDQLEPYLDAFANAMVEVENVIGIATGSASGTSNPEGNLPGLETFYFKIPSNPTLVGKWGTVADRLNKLRHCQNIAGAPLQLALFDAPIDPGLLVAAQSAGVDLSSVLSDLGAPLPNYRFTALYPVAADFVSAVRAYGTSLQAALEKTDAGAFTLLQQTTQQQLLADGHQVLDWQVQQAQSNIDAASQTLALAQQKYNFNTSQTFLNAGEGIEITIGGLFIVNYLIAAFAEGIGSIEAVIPEFSFGAAGFGGSPSALAAIGGENYHATSTSGANVGKAIAAVFDKTATLAGKLGGYERRKDNWDEAAAEAKIQIAQAQIQIDGLKLGLQVAQQNQILHQEQIDNLQKQIDFLNNKFTNDSLYDWMISSLSATYFQSYQLAYQMCKQVERCYQFELGIQNSSFIQFGYWDSLHKGLLSGETLNHDLRRMQASYLQQNERRKENSRFISLVATDPDALKRLLVDGACDFTVPESLFDNDYPSQYNRRLTRVSVTVVYPNPGKFDNIKATLTMVSNKVRISTDTSTGYTENPVGADPRFIYNYAAVPQNITLGNGQDDPGLFLTTLSNNLSDQRYSPFENGGGASSWNFEMQQACNEVDLSTIGDVYFHFYYTALEGGDDFKQVVQANNAASQPKTGTRLFSAQNDFSAPAPTKDSPYPVSPWQSFIAAPAAGANQLLTLSISPSKFPVWTRGQTIKITSMTFLAVSWEAASFVIVPQAPLPIAPINLTPLPGVTEPNVCSGTLVLPNPIQPGSWGFELQLQGAADFRSLTKNMLGDLILLINFTI